MVLNSHSAKVYLRPCRQQFIPCRLRPAEELVLLEPMKIDILVMSKHAATVTEMLLIIDDIVQKGDVLLVE